MGGGSSSPSHTTTTQELDPQLQQWMSGTFGYAKDIAGQPYQPYEGQRFADLNQLQQLGIGKGVQSALQGEGRQTVGQAANAVQSAVQGGPGQVSADQWGTQQYQQYVNPYNDAVLDQTMQRINQQLAHTQQQTNAAATGAGAFGGTRMAIRKAENAENANELKAQAAAKLNQQGYQNALSAFQNDRAASMAAQQANQEAGLEYTKQQLQAAGLLGRLGGRQQQMAQNAANAIFNYGQPGYNLANKRLGFKYNNEYANPIDAQYRKLQALNSVVSGMPTFGTKTTSRPTYSNPVGSALGGAASGAAVGSMFGPIGMGVGAAAGGLLGLFG